MTLVTEGAATACPPPPVPPVIANELADGVPLSASAELDVDLLMLLQGSGFTWLAPVNKA